MTEGLQVGIVSAGAALLVPAIVAGWKAASMRADLNREWRGRVDLIITGLSEQAAQALVEVQRLIRDFIVEGSVTFDPLRVVHEPADLKGPMKHFLRLLKVRDKTSRRFRHLLQVGPTLLVFDSLYAIGVVVAVLGVSDIVHRPGLGRVGLWMGVAGAAGVIAGFSMYAYLEHMLSGAELLSQSDG